MTLEQISSDKKDIAAQKSIQGIALKSRTPIQEKDIPSQASSHVDLRSPSVAHRNILMLQRTIGNQLTQKQLSIPRSTIQRKPLMDSNEELSKGGLSGHSDLLGNESTRGLKPGEGICPVCGKVGKGVCEGCGEAFVARQQSDEHLSESDNQSIDAELATKALYQVISENAQHKTILANTDQKSAGIQRQANILHSIEDCETEKEDCDERCRKLPNKTKMDKFNRYLCWTGCINRYAKCLATANETLTFAAIVAAVMLAAADGPLPFGEAAAAALVTSVGVTQQ